MKSSKNPFAASCSAEPTLNPFASPSSGPSANSGENSFVSPSGKHQLFAEKPLANCSDNPFASPSANDNENPFPSPNSQANNSENPFAAQPDCASIPCAATPKGGTAGGVEQQQGEGAAGFIEGRLSKRSKHIRQYQPRYFRLNFGSALLTCESCVR